MLSSHRHIHQERHVRPDHPPQRPTLRLAARLQPDLRQDQRRDRVQHQAGGRGRAQADRAGRLARQDRPARQQGRHCPFTHHAGRRTGHRRAQPDSRRRGSQGRAQGDQGAGHQPGSGGQRPIGALDRRHARQQCGRQHLHRALHQDEPGRPGGRAGPAAGWHGHGFQGRDGPGRHAERLRPRRWLRRHRQHRGIPLQHQGRGRARRCQHGKTRRRRHGGRRRAGGVAHGFRAGQAARAADQYPGANLRGQQEQLRQPDERVRRGQPRPAPRGWRQRRGNVLPGRSHHGARGVGDGRRPRRGRRPAHGRRQVQPAQWQQGQAARARIEDRQRHRAQRVPQHVLQS